MHSSLRRSFSRLRSEPLRLEALEERRLLAATPQLLADVNTQQSGNPRNLTEFDGRLFYTVSDGEFGRELWASDGTPEGTQLVKDVYPGYGSSNIANLTVSGDWLYFTARDNLHGTELWRTDGTTAGTELFREFKAGSADGMAANPNLTDVAGTLYFVTNSDGLLGANLWRTDGTQAGTINLLTLDTYGDLDELTAVGSTLYFSRSISYSNEELWKSDGTPAGTALVKDISPGSSSSSPSDLTEFAGQLFFVAYNSGYKLYRSDGTAAGTTEVVGSPSFSVSPSSELAVVGDKLFVGGNNSGAGYRLWTIDSGLLATPVGGEPQRFSNYPTNFTVVDNELYFLANSYQSSESRVWKSDGTAAGTIPLAALNADGQYRSVRELTAYNGQLFFIAYVFDESAPELWRSDGTPGGTGIFRTNVGPLSAASSLELQVAAGKLFFSADMTPAGLELWLTDGSQAGTQLVQDQVGIATDPSHPKDFVTTTTHVFFTAEDGRGRQLFATPGAQGPAELLTPGAQGPGETGAEQLVVAGDRVYFSATDSNGHPYLGQSNGTWAGTRRFGVGTDGTTVHGIKEFDGGVIFLVNDPVNGLSLMRAKGNLIEQVARLGNYVSFLDYAFEAVTWQGQYYFTPYVNGFDLWRSDGTAEGTRKVRETVPDLGTFGRSLTATDSALYFVSASASQSPGRLWRTDGTAAGSYAYAFMPAPLGMTGAGNFLYYVVQGNSFPNQTTGQTLWATDGTIPGTRPLAPYWGPTVSSNPDLPPPLDGVEYNGELYFFGPNSFSPSLWALWKSDGTPGGTSRVADLAAPGGYYGSSMSTSMTVADGTLFVRVSQLVYQSDGTTAGTRKLFDNFQQRTVTDGLAQLLTSFGGTLYFTNSTIGGEPLTYTHEYASVAGRHLFYNNSKFDGGNVSLDWQDDAAIATDKTAYLPGSGAATFASISSYSRGINGVMVDLANLPQGNEFGPLSLSDFRFRMGGSTDPASWSTAPAPSAFLVRDGFGPQGTTKRVSFRWSELAIANTWLEVTVLASTRTGLAAADTFYFGNRIGDTGLNTPPASFITSAGDEIGARGNGAALQGVTNIYDFNRDSVVGAGDQLIARNNGGLLTRLNLAGPLAALADDDTDGASAIASALNVPASDQPATTATPIFELPIAEPLIAVPLIAEAAAGAMIGVSQNPLPTDRGLSLALVQEWLKRASESLEDSPLDDGLLSLLSAARSRLNLRP